MCIGVGCAALLVVANLPNIALSAAIATAPHRPELLRDAVWGKPNSAIKFKRRVGRDVRESESLSWLGANYFTFDRSNRDAVLLVKSLPCNESINVKWSVGTTGRIGAANALFRDAGCL